MMIFDKTFDLEYLTEFELLNITGGQQEPKGIVQWIFYGLHYTIDHMSNPKYAPKEGHVPQE